MTPRDRDGPEGKALTVLPKLECSAVLPQLATLVGINVAAAAINSSALAGRLGSASDEGMEGWGVPKPNDAREAQNHCRERDTSEDSHCVGTSLLGAAGLSTQLCNGRRRGKGTRPPAKD